MARYGKTKTVPWKKVKKKHTDETQWKQFWPAAALSETVNVPQVAAEFYMLEMISAHVGIHTPSVAAASELPISSDEFFELLRIEDADVRNRLLAARRERLGGVEIVDKLSDVRRTALVSLAALVEKYEPTFYQYLTLAIGGELRHHVAVGKVLHEKRHWAWCDWADIIEAHGAKAVLTAAELFREFPKEAGYGGEPWAQAADILASRMEGRLGPDQKTNDRLFVDRVWTLEHNNGCILNKVPWIDLDSIQYVLNAHASNPVNVKALYAKSGATVKALWDAYLVACNELREQDGAEPVVDTASLLTYYAVCSECSSNAAIGHHFGCSVPGRSDFGPIDFANTKSFWYNLYDDEQVHLNTHNFENEKLPIGPDGWLRLPSDTQVRAKVTVRRCRNGSTTEFTDGYIETSWSILLSTVVDIRDVGSSSEDYWDDEVTNIEFRLSVYAVDHGSDVFRIARAYSYYDIEKYVDGQFTIQMGDWLTTSTHALGAIAEGEQAHDVQLWYNL